MVRAAIKESCVLFLHFLLFLIIFFIFFIPLKGMAITGGKILPAQVYAEVVELKNKCTGTVIAPGTLITAAHCVFHPYLDSFRKGAGEIILKDNKTIIPQNIMISPQFAQSRKDLEHVELASQFDMAIVTYDPQELAQLSISGYPAISPRPMVEGESVTMIGYGASDTSEAIGVQGLKKILPQMGIKRIGHNTLTASEENRSLIIGRPNGEEENKSTGASGDSGGPVFNSQGQLISLVSQGADPFSADEADIHGRFENGQVVWKKGPSPIPGKKTIHTTLYTNTTGAFAKDFFRKAIDCHGGDQSQMILWNNKGPCADDFLSSQLLSYRPPVACKQKPLSQAKSEENFNELVIKLQRQFLKKKLRELNLKMADDFIKAGKLQEAMWAYHRAGEENKKQELKQMLKGIMEETMKLDFDQIPNKTKLKGSTGAELISLENFKGVLKRNFAKNSNARHEEAAYRLDELLGLDLVPMTISGREGQVSLQYFVGDTHPPHNPLPSQKKELSKDMRFFDFLIKNIDRNKGNYLITNYKIQNREPMTVAIDHGLSFSTLSHPKIPAVSASQYLPREKVYERLKDFDVEQFQKDFSDLLTEKEIQTFLQRRTYLMGVIESYLEKIQKQKDQKGGLWPDDHEAMGY